MGVKKIDNNFSFKDVNFTESYFDDVFFAQLAKYLKDLTGISLENNSKNQALVHGRLSKLLLNEKIVDHKEILSRLNSKNPEFTKKFVSAMTTNTTEFFRESKHFDVLTDMIPKIIDSKPAHEKEMRLWCCASSTGQEIYSLGMTLMEAQEKKHFSLKMLASDIDYNVLKKASSGIYAANDVLGSVAPYLISKYFTRGTGECKNTFQIKDHLKDSIRFLMLNLMDHKYPFQHKFDIIFCRNVLIYFDAATVEKVIEKLIQNLNPGGYLFLGHSEGQVDLHKKLTRVANTVYQYKK